MLNVPVVELWRAMFLKTANDMFSKRSKIAVRPQLRTVKGGCWHCGSKVWGVCRGCTVESNLTKIGTWAGMFNGWVLLVCSILNKEWSWIICTEIFDRGSLPLWSRWDVSRLWVGGEVVVGVLRMCCVECIFYLKNRNEVIVSMNSNMNTDVFWF